MKKEIYLFMFSMVLVLLVGSFASAGVFSDVWGKITGYAESSTTALNITVSANSAPTIIKVDTIVDITPNEGGVNSTEFNFTVRDTDGGGNIDISTAEARFELAGETTRLNTTCTNSTAAIGNDLNLTCTIGMHYFDKNDANWVINVTVQDIVGVRAINSSTTFSHTSLKAMAMSPIALTWAPFGVSDTNQESDNDPITVNNTGNNIDLSLNVTAFNLQGETTATEFIFAGNFSIENVTTTCSGTTPVNATSTNITSTILQRGNNSLNNNNATSGQEQMFFCVTAVNSDLSTQSYSSAAYGSWIIKII